ncbi:MAG TPA: hypothetical protein VIY48_21690 [Candidatus Paceibacterota bacterium]
MADWCDKDVKAILKVKDAEIARLRAENEQLTNELDKPRLPREELQNFADAMGERDARIAELERQLAEAQEKLQCKTLT